MTTRYQGLALMSVALFTALAVACSDSSVETSPTQDISAFVAMVRDVRGVAMDRPPQPRPWDTSTVALEEALLGEEGHAVLAFKAPSSERAIETGYREAVPASAIIEGLELLVSRDVFIHQYYAFIGAAHVQLPPGVATELRTHPLVDYIEPRQWWTLQGGRAPGAGSP